MARPATPRQLAKVLLLAKPDSLDAAAELITIRDERFLNLVRARIETALSTCAPGHEREAVLSALDDVESEVKG